MNKRFFAVHLDDADLWRKNGLTAEDEDAVILALWRWRRGRADDQSLTVPARLIYAPIIARWAHNDTLSEMRSSIGRRGAEARWHNLANGKNDGKGNGKVMPRCKCPTSSSTSTSSSTPSSFADSDVGDTPEPPCVSGEDLTKAGGDSSCGKAARFVKPTIDEVRTYCSTQGITNVDAEQFMDYYDGNGWMVGKVKMKDWQATIRNWSRRHPQSGGHNNSPIGMVFKNSNKENYDEEL